MAKWSYFTDGSVKGGIGVGGFIKTDSMLHIMDSGFYGVCDNSSNFCEAVAINKALENIIKFGDKSDKHIVYTDSDACVKMIQVVLKFACEDKLEKLEEKSVYTDIMRRVSEKYLWLIGEGFKINFKLVKSHVKKAKEQIQYQDKIGSKFFDSNDLKFMTSGNSLIDRMVKFSVEDLNFIEGIEDDEVYVYEITEYVKRRIREKLANKFAA